MEKLLTQVREFMEAAGQRVGREPGDVYRKQAELGLSLIKEEVAELSGAMRSGGELGTERVLCDIADALADITYVTAWTALAFGIPLDRILEEVHRTNMAKFGPGSHKDPATGKQLKPPGWRAPDLRPILFPRGGSSK